MLLLRSRQLAGVVVVTLVLALGACDTDPTGRDPAPDAAPATDVGANAAEAGPDGVSPSPDGSSPSPDGSSLSPDGSSPDGPVLAPDAFPPPPPPCTSKTSSSCSAYLLLGKGKVRYWRTYALGAPNAQVKRAVVVVHGSSLNADDYFGYVVSAAKTAGALASTTIVAPRFPESAGASDELYWSSTWRSGGDGKAPNGATISSYGVMDAIIAKLGDLSTYPNLGTIVVTGHSAGGQYAQRYGAAGKAAPTGVKLRYAPANPSSYLYFNGYRRVKGVFVNSGATFSACPGYDDYKYGLKQRTGWPYLAAQSDAALKSKYLSREVVYLLGAADTCNSDLDSTCNDNGLAKSCSAMLQGDHRYERGQNYWAHIKQYFAGHPHKLQVIPGVGHSGSQIFNSSGGRAVLFK